MRSFTIARNTFRETFHLPVLHVVIIGSVVVLAIAGQLPRFTLSIYDDIKMLKDLAMATATLCGMLVAILAAAHSITSELDNWTVVTVLSKPVRRWEFVVGKAVGLAFVLVVLFAILTVVYILLVWWGMWVSITDYQGVYPELKRNFWVVAWQAADEMARGMLLSLSQVLVLSSVAVACCVRVSMIISVVIFFLVFVAGHFVAAISAAAARTSTVVGSTVAALVCAVIPDLEALNFSQEIGTQQTISASVMGWGFLYALVYGAAVVLVATLLFRNREVI